MGKLYDSQNKSTLKYLETWVRKWKGCAKPHNDTYFENMPIVAFVSTE